VRLAMARHAAPVCEGLGVVGVLLALGAFGVGVGRVLGGERFSVGLRSTGVLTSAAKRQ